MTLMIDRRGSADRDDALHVQPAADGWTVTVHITDVPAGLILDSVPDVEARRRGQTHYGAAAVRHMLPEPLVRSLTLSEAFARPTLTVTLTIAADGSTTAATLARGKLRKPAAMPHEEVVAALADRDHPHHEMLAHAERCAWAMHGRRRDTGALAVYDLTRGWATDEDGQLVRLDAPERNIGYIIVQECMIAANTAVAAWAIERDVPILFRNHVAAAATPPTIELAADVEAAVLSHAAGQLDAARQRLALVMRAATYAPTARGHYALTLPAYTHATSPLRRYADVITMRQVLAALDGNAPPHSFDELEALAERLNTAAAEQRERKAAALKERAHAGARTAAAGEEFAHLPPAKFSAVLKRACKEDLYSDPLSAEIQRRADAGALALADVMHVLVAGGISWADARRACVARIATEPHTAVSALAAYATRHGLPPAHFAYEVTGQSPAEVFVSKATLDGVSGSRRQAPTKKGAQQQAAVSLLAALAEVEDPSTDVATAVSAPDNPPPVLDGHHPISALNEYAQSGYVTRIDWTVNRAGPPHAPVFTAWVHADVTGRGELRASGDAATKAGARERAAAALLNLIRETS